MQKNNGTQNNTASRMTDFSIHDAQSAPIGYTSETDSTHLSTNSIRRNAENGNSSGENNSGDVTQAPHADTALGTTPEATLASLSPLSESTDQLLDNRLRLPELVADDTLVLIVYPQMRRMATGLLKYSEQKRNHPSSTGSSSAPFGRGAQNTRMVYENSITPDGANGNASGTKFKGLALQRDQQSQRLYLHDVVALKNQGQKNKTQTWHQNPDVSRSSSNLDISNILRNALDGNIQGTKIKEIPDTSGKHATLLAQSTSTFGNLNDDSIAPNRAASNISNKKRTDT